MLDNLADKDQKERRHQSCLDLKVHGNQNEFLFPPSLQIFLISSHQTPEKCSRSTNLFKCFYSRNDGINSSFNAIVQCLWLFKVFISININVFFYVF